MYRQSEKNLLSSNISSTCPRNMVNFGPLAADFVSLGHPCKFQWVSRLGSITARHSSSGCQPNFAALNRGRHLYLAGRPSRWALAHISSYYFFKCWLFLHKNTFLGKAPQSLMSHLSLKFSQWNAVIYNILLLILTLCTSKAYLSSWSRNTCRT